jgi:hypothetical protein
MLSLSFSLFARAPNSVARVQKTFSAEPRSFSLQDHWFLGRRTGPVQPLLDSRRGRIASKVFFTAFFHAAAGERTHPIRDRGCTPTPFTGLRPLSLNSFNRSGPRSGPGRASGGDGLANLPSRRRRSPRVTDSPGPARSAARPPPPIRRLSQPPPSSRRPGPETSSRHHKPCSGSSS